MKPIEHNTETIRLTSSEIGHLWNTYILESMVHHMFSYFLQHVVDTNIKDILEICVHTTNDSLDLLDKTFKKAGMHTPRGTNSEDVFLTVPRLYSDIFYVLYLNSMAQFALTTYSAAYSQSSREDIRKFFKHFLNRLILVNQQVTDLMLKKGIYVRPPFVPTRLEKDIVTKESFLTGFISDKRPLSIFEISNIFFDAQMNAVGKVLITGFIQVTKSKELSKYLIKGKELASKYYHDFSNIFLEEDIAVPPSYDGEVMASTESPFSERLMLFHTIYLTSFGLATYGNALSAVQRHDLSALYTKIMAQVGVYANNGVKLMIQNKWMEQPPLAPDRKATAKT
jgi:hypothetical protein